MKKLFNSVCLAAAMAVALPTAAQQARVNSTGGNSPHETTSAVVSGNRVTITYGRPFAKGRKIWGTLVPWGKAWRMGSDEATVLITQQPIAFGDTTIPAGAYTLYMVPDENGTSKLAFSKKLGPWGIPVDEKNDVARVDLKKENLDAPVEQFTMAVQRVPDGGAIVLKWENTQYSAAFTVKK